MRRWKTVLLLPLLLMLSYCSYVRPVDNSCKVEYSELLGRKKTPLLEIAQEGLYGIESSLAKGGVHVENGHVKPALDIKVGNKNLRIKPKIDASSNLEKYEFMLDIKLGR